MEKKVFEKTNLICMFQNEAEITVQSPVCGLLSIAPTDGSILFQETLPRKRDIRNIKLYAGKYVSMVRRKDGLYYPFLKAFKAEDVIRNPNLSYQIQREICDMLTIIPNQPTHH